MSRFRNLLLLAACVLAFRPAYAQISIYGTFAPVHASSVPSGVAPGNGSTQYTSFWANGIGGGVTVNFLPLPIVSLGLDLRGSTRSGVPGVDTALVGLKLGVHPPLLRIKPYLQASTGYLATRAHGTGSNAGTSYTDKELMYEILGGIDYPLIHFLDFRMIELGGGQVIGAGGSQTPSIFTVNTGLVLHF